MIQRHADYAPDARFDADVIVIGTGAGGAVVGAGLAEAGLDVLFVEEGAWHPTTSFNPYLYESAPRLYREGGATMIYGRPSFSYLEGRCVGGSTTVNGGMAYRPPEHVLDGWARITGQPDLSPAGLEPYLARVEERVHARRQAPWSVGGDNRLMREGARQKGWYWSENPRNQDRCVGANNCSFGCPTGAKQSTLVSYMPRAMAHGARCLTQVRVTGLLIEGGRCVGVEGRDLDPRTNRPDQRITARAAAVVVACGAVQTPVLLKRHRLGRPSGQLGRNFLCHPNMKVVAAFPFDVKSWRGVSQWGQIREHHEEGILFAENMVPPGALATTLPMDGPAMWEMMTRYDQILLAGALVEDSTSGVVHRGPGGMAFPRYDITAWDHARFVKAVRLLGGMLFDLGADTLMLPFKSMPIARGPDDLARVDDNAIRRKDLELFTAHLMGTARMGSRPESSVVDLDGQLWDLPGCYVADASIFPTAIGVNPQITIMALAERIADRLAEGWSALRRAA